MHNKFCFYRGMVLIALLVSQTAYALEFDQNALDKANKEYADRFKPKVKAKPQHKAVKKHHHAKKVEDDPEPKMTEQQIQEQLTKIESDMVAIKGGCFLMGSPENEPERESDEKQHQECVKDFKMGKYEITQAQWKAVKAYLPTYSEGGNFPALDVPSNFAQDFISKLNQMTGKSYRLPTEAEWEYAARAGTTTPFYTGNCINTNQANYKSTYDKYDKYNRTYM